MSAPFDAGVVAARREALDARFTPWEPMTLDGLLDRAASEFGDRPYVITEDATYTYTQIQEWSSRIARGLVAVGVRPGDHVGLVMGNYPEFVATKYAIARTGAVTIPINFLNRRDELAYVLRQSDTSVLVTMDSFRSMDYLAMLDEIAPGWETNGGGDALPDLERVVVFPTGAGPERAGATTLAQLEELGGSGPLFASLASPGDMADILYTSGTTGHPKGVILTHDMLTRTAYGAARSRAFQDARRIVFSLPMYHVYGYVEGMLAVPFVGGSIVPQLTFSGEATLDAIVKHAADDVLLIPTMTVDMVGVLEKKSYDLSGLTSVISSGGYSPPWIWERIWSDLAPNDLTTGYGMSETTATTVMTEPGGPKERIATTNGPARNAGPAGDPALGGAMVVYKVVDQYTGEDLAPGEVGELLCKGPGMTPGYYKKPEETAAAFDEDGWFHSGDIGNIDQEGYLTLGGRMKDLYRCGGEQVVPKEIEDVLLVHPAVLQAHIVPIPDERMGEVGVAWIVLRDGAKATDDELRAFASERLARFKVPRHVVFAAIDDIPTTPSGRPRKFILAERAQAMLTPA